MSASKAATVALVEHVSPLPTLAPSRPSLDAGSRGWLQQRGLALDTWLEETR